MKRKSGEHQKLYRSNKSSTKKRMDGKERINKQRITPHTERNTPGRNWEKFKNSVSNSPSLSIEKSGKEDLRKKLPPYQNARKKQKNTGHVSQINEEVVCDKEKQKLTKHLAMDCEMVGIGDGTKSMIARVSIVNRHGFCIYDKYVKPREPIKDYRTKVSGIRPHDLQNGEEFQIVQKEVADILKGRILIGHALQHDLDVLYLTHPRRHVRDTSRFKIFKQLSTGNTPSLKKLVHELLGREIQTGEHNSIEDAKAAMQLYMLYRNKWESEFYSKR